VQIEQHRAIRGREDLRYPRDLVAVAARRIYQGGDVFDERRGPDDGSSTIQVRSSAFDRRQRSRRRRQMPDLYAAASDEGQMLRCDIPFVRCFSIPTSVCGHAAGDRSIESPAAFLLRTMAAVGAK